MAVRLESSYSPLRAPIAAGGGAKLQKPGVVSMPSPNQNSRPGGANDISAIVLHHTAGGGTAQGVGRYFQNAASQVSSHYIVGKDGTIVQSVPDSKRSWHAGVSSFGGRGDVNDFSLGIEIVNVGDGRDPYTDAQYNALINLVAWMCQTYGIPVSRITGHKDIALPKGRKTDPSPNFDWNRVRRGVEAKLGGSSAPSAPAAPAPGNSGDTGLYTVRNGDSLSSIAKRLLGDANRWQEIYALNRDQISNPNVIRPGQVLKVPGQASKPAPSNGGTTYTVRNGDSLSSIAKSQLGDAKRWREIYDLNRDRISNPNLIYPGQTLKLPARGASTPGPKPTVPPAPTPPVSQPTPAPAPTPTPAPVPTPPVSQPTVPPAPPAPPAPSLPVVGDVGTGLRLGGAVMMNYLESGAASGGIAQGILAPGVTGGVRGFFSGIVQSLPSLLKRNFVTAALVSAVTNGMDLLKGRVTGKQAAAGFAADTVAYTGIGATSTAIGAAVGSLLGPLGTIGGLLVGSALGVGMGWLYEKFGRSKLVTAFGNLFGR